LSIVFVELCIIIKNAPNVKGKVNDILKKMKIVCISLWLLIMQNKTNYILWTIFRLYLVVIAALNREIPQNRRILRDFGLKVSQGIFLSYNCTLTPDFAFFASRADYFISSRNRLQKPIAFLTFRTNRLLAVFFFRFFDPGPHQHFFDWVFYRLFVFN